MSTETRSSEPVGPPAFVWPPRSAGPLPPPLSTNAQVRQGPTGLGAIIESVETDLLGRTALSFERWAQRTGWLPDDPGRYCWRCAGSVGAHELDGEGCATCRTKKLPWQRAMRLGIHDNELRDEVLALKFHAWRPGGDGLGMYLGQVIAAQLSRAQIEPSRVRLVPIPTNRWRRIARGVDHTLVLARSASRVVGCPLVQALRARYRSEQVGLTATARAANMKGAFEIRTRLLERCLNASDDPARVWVLIDDVRTTGMTFTAGAKALRKGLQSRFAPDLVPEIWVCSVTVAGERDRREPVEYDSEGAEIVVRRGSSRALIGTEQMRRVSQVET